MMSAAIDNNEDGRKASAVRQWLRIAELQGGASLRESDQQQPIVSLENLNCKLSNGLLS